MGNNYDSVMGSIINTLKGRPDIILMLIVVGGFLFHIERKEIRDIAQQQQEAARLDLVAEQRIETCHDIQHRGIEAMNANTAALIMHAEKDTRLSEKIETMVITVSGNTDAINDLKMAVQHLIDTSELNRDLAIRSHMNSNDG